MVLLIAFISTTAYTKFNKRRDNDTEEWKLPSENAFFNAQILNEFWTKMATFGDVQPTNSPEKNTTDTISTNK